MWVPKGVNGMDVAQVRNVSERKVQPHFSHMTGQSRLSNVPGELHTEQPKPSNGVEYDAFEVGDFVSDWVSNTSMEFQGPLIDLTKVWFPDDKYPVFTGLYGKTLRKRLVFFGINTSSTLLGGMLANMVRRAVHRVRPDKANEPQPGLGASLPGPNILAAQLVKTVATGLAGTWLSQAYLPPPAPPAPPPKPGDPPPPPPAEAKKGPIFLGKDLRDIAHSTALFGVSVLLSKVYDQTVGPIVQRTINKVTGHGDDPIAKPSPITPGGIASTLGSVFLSGLLMRPVEWKNGVPGLALTGPTMAGAGPAPGGHSTLGAIAGMGGAGSILAQAAMNGLISTAFDTVYDRSVGPAISNAVNGLAGVAPEERDPAPMTSERLVRSVARGSVAATGYYLTDLLTQPFFTTLATHIGGTAGAFVAMAGAALLGMTAATATDALLGNVVGKAAGSIWSWASGKPMVEDRPKPEPQPADPAQAKSATAGMRAPNASVQATQLAAIAVAH
jgi:hypothetical protein